MKQLFFPEMESVNKLNPRETAASTDARPWLHMSSEGGNETFTGTEISFTWKFVSFPELSSKQASCEPSGCISLFYFFIFYKLRFSCNRTARNKRHRGLIKWRKQTKDLDVDRHESFHGGVVSLITGHPAGPVGSRCSLHKDKSEFDQTRVIHCRLTCNKI